MMCRLRKNRSRVVGLKQTKKALEQDQASTVYLAEDADPYLKQEISNLCAAKKVQLKIIATKAELGKACGIDVGSATAALLRDN